MNTISLRLAALALIAFTRLAAAEDFLDRAADVLTVSAFHGGVRARLSGLFDVEGYVLDQPSPGLIYTDDREFLNYRFSFFLDAQLGSKVYAFVQARVDREFDPSESEARGRLDEYAVRVTPWENGRFSLQVGKFGTIAGNWVQRHDSWSTPFITAPLPYENLTGIWDSYGVDEREELLYWAHVSPEQRGESAAAVNADKRLRVPIIWGPSYTTGAAVFGALGKFEYAAEIKNAALSSRPESWDVNEVGFDQPAFTTRFGFRPNPTWNFGVSGSTSSYLLPSAAIDLPVGKDLSDYRQLLIAQDISFEWHHLQIWAEFFETRFEIPNIGNADTFAYYVEAKYKFTPQLFGALRWNQQVFSTLPDEVEGPAVWGRDIWRIDSALGYRFSAHTQLKLQYTFQSEAFARRTYSQMLAGQFSLKF